MQRRHLLLTSATLPLGTITLGTLATMSFSPLAQAHHGWSSFDQDRPVYLEGKARKVTWQNPHTELELEITSGLKLPTDLATRAVLAQAAPVDSKALRVRL